MTVNHWVAGSSPARGASKVKGSAKLVLNHSAIGIYFLIALAMFFIIQATLLENLLQIQN